MSFLSGIYDAVSRFRNAMGNRAGRDGDSGDRFRNPGMRRGIGPVRRNNRRVRGYSR